MVGRDVNSLPIQYRTWVVDDLPDFGGFYYTGLKSGPLPFVDVSAYEIQDGYAVVDFNLPDPLNWHKTYSVMPEAMGQSQLAILDGYAYLFGSAKSATILRADLNNPADWVDTGATLPHTLCNSQLAVIGSRVYLFGGLGGTPDEATDEVFSAPIADPLTWTNHGSKLPEPLQKSALAYADGYIYLFGGMDKKFARDIIWRAPVTDPLTWTDTGVKLPVKLYGTNVAILTNKILLLGGMFADDAPTDTIYTASLSNPLLWSLGGHLPAPAGFGQFITVGNQGYLYTQAEVTSKYPYQTRIFRCEKSAPFNWIDMQRVIPADIHQSQFGIIYDRIFSFGGNGITAIFACDQILKYTTDYPKGTQYGAVTRTNYVSTPNPLDLNALLGFPYWKTDYQR